MAERNYIFRFETKTAHYGADAFAVRCFDNRFWKTFKRFIKHLGIDHIDAEAVAGGAKIFSSPEKESDRDFMLRELEKSILLHHTTRVLLFTHEDCGAYGGSGRFDGNKDKEFAYHIAEHKKARNVIESKFPGMLIETYFIDFEGVVKTS